MSKSNIEISFKDACVIKNALEQRLELKEKEIQSYKFMEMEVPEEMVEEIAAERRAYLRVRNGIKLVEGIR